MKSILIIIGTRPECIKMAPIILSMQKSSCLKPVICLTGQHNIEDMNKVLELFNISKPEHNLNVSVSEVVNLHLVASNILLQVTNVLTNNKIDAVMVQGDTSSAYMSALASFYLKIPVIHIEAGLRTFDMENPFPEEFNRCAISLIAKYNFASSSDGYKNLQDENVKNIYYVGNTIVDALFYIKNKIDKQKKKKEKTILITCHRRENWKYIENLCIIINTLSDKYINYKFLICMHPNPVLQENLRKYINKNDNIVLMTNVNYDKFVELELNSNYAISDSGGLQEELSVLGIPALITRTTSERMEGVRSGITKLVSLQDITTVLNEFETIINPSYYQMFMRYMNSSKCLNDYKNGNASENIIKILEKKI